ncbi:MAG: LuxR C-terminal-related transcriptional regulator, partial [Dehalococcoidia bacterium]|nr:LuxR C-terminal-related transcriptional regulator [Dehalococcoidia bacterium]
VIYYLISGLSDDEIAKRLYISKLTVHTHIKNIYRKLGTKSRIELYRRVIREYSIANLADVLCPNYCPLKWRKKIIN